MELPSGVSKVRDVYVCQCFMGLRVADAVKLLCNLPLHIKEVAGKRFLEIKTAKTGEVVVIPMATVVVQIAEKRNYDFGKPFSQQHYHKTLRKIIASSNFDREVIFNRTEGGVMQERTMLYSELIGTHTARRTFATNAYLAGLNPVDIMKITGHRSFSSFIRYIRCENTAVALKISNHEFFTMPLNEV
ncbi:tyrosine-type recombinase/integrase [Capnocytophaga sp.]|uniref:tyrosine-type recombinase/integrase n=1 Tax=Capnocytophaga sp. TaxID=44737 RepID=UPI0026DC3732|nr:tyrosine-type recombinase/integrase [Capnocytophaga sp.]MDO5106135.1 tyrosine-type recombinase/integrase [Capnocytophaga sp.]